MRQFQNHGNPIVGSLLGLRVFKCCRMWSFVSTMDMFLQSGRMGSSIVRPTGLNWFVFIWHVPSRCRCWKKMLMLLQCRREMHAMELELMFLEKSQTNNASECASIPSPNGPTHKTHWTRTFHDHAKITNLENIHGKHVKHNTQSQSKNGASTLEKLHVFLA